MGDIHVHTEFSCDSEAKMEDYILEAKKKGVSMICFTDHVDLNTNAMDMTTIWQEVLKTAKAGGFDALGHIDFPKRYYGEIYYEESIINEIFRNLLEKDLVIYWRFIKLMAGKYVTIGSDAHVVEDIGADYMTAKCLLQEMGLQEVVYKQRKRYMV